MTLAKSFDGPAQGFDLRPPARPQVLEHRGLVGRGRRNQLGIERFEIGFSIGPIDTMPGPFEDREDLSDDPAHDFTSRLGRCEFAITSIRESA